MKRFISTLLALCMILPMTVFASSDEQSQIAALLQEALPRAIARGAFAIPEGTDPDALYLTDEIPMYRYANGNYQENTDVSIYFIRDTYSILGVVYHTAESGISFGVSYAPILQAILSETNGTHLALITLGESLFCQVNYDSVHTIANHIGASITSASSNIALNSLSPEVSIGIISNTPVSASAVMLYDYPIVSQYTASNPSERMMCTIASTTSVINYVLGTNYSLLQIADAFEYTVGSNAGTNLFVAKNILLNYGIPSTFLGTLYSSPYPLLFSTVKDNIDSGKPIPVTTFTSYDTEDGDTVVSGHTVVVCGYEIMTSSLDLCYYMDPGDDNYMSHIVTTSSSFFFYNRYGLRYDSTCYLTLSGSI